MNDAIAYLYDNVKKFRIGVGHALNTRFWITDLPKQPPHIKKNLEEAINHLVAEGIFELKNGSPFLTQEGYDKIYGL